MGNYKLQGEIADIALLLYEYNKAKKEAENFRGSVAAAIVARAHEDAALSEVLDRVKCLIAMVQDK